VDDQWQTNIDVKHVANLISFIDKLKEPLGKAKDVNLAVQGCNAKLWACSTVKLV
jgi:hypothetical protein